MSDAINFENLLAATKGKRPLSELNLYFEGISKLSLEDGVAAIHRLLAVGAKKSAQRYWSHFAERYPSAELIQLGQIVMQDDSHHYPLRESIWKMIESGQFELALDELKREANTFRKEERLSYIRSLNRQLFRFTEAANPHSAAKDGHFVLKRAFIDHLATLNAKSELIAALEATECDDELQAIKESLLKSEDDEGLWIKSTNAIDVFRVPKNCDDALASMRFHLNESGYITDRIYLCDLSIKIALNNRATIFIPEEQSTGCGAIRLLGYHTLSKMLLIQNTTSLLSRLRPLTFQHKRSELFGFSALIIWPKEKGQLHQQAALNSGLKRDEHLDAIDKIFYNEDKLAPPLPWVIRFSADSFRAVPSLPLFAKLHGEALLNELAQKKREEKTHNESLIHYASEGFLSFLANLYRRFNGKTWIKILHARWLVVARRFSEAAIIFNDALLSSPDDPLLLAGNASGLLEMGRHEEARLKLEKAACLAPDHASYMAKLARISWVIGEKKRAKAEAEFALELDELAEDAIAIHVDLIDDAGSISRDIEEILKRTIALLPENRTLVPRLISYYFSHGNWSEAERIAEKETRSSGNAVENWQNALEIAYCRGDRESALNYGLDGLRRFGGDSRLVDGLAMTLTDLYAAKDLPGPLESILGVIFEVDPLCAKQFALKLSDVGYDELALRTMDAAKKHIIDEINSYWHRIQVILALKDSYSNKEELLEESLERMIQCVPFFAYAQIIRACRYLKRGEAELALGALSQASIEQAPAPIWWLMADALFQLGRTDEANEVRRRLPEVYPEGVLEHVDFLAQLGYSQLALSLLDDLLSCEMVTLSEIERYRIHLSKAKHFSCQEKLELALNEFEKAFEIACRDSFRHWQVSFPTIKAAEIALSLGRDLEVKQFLAKWNSTDNKISATESLWQKKTLEAIIFANEGDSKFVEGVLKSAADHPKVNAKVFSYQAKKNNWTCGVTHERMREIAPGLYQQILALQEEKCDA